MLDFLDQRFPAVGREAWRHRLEAGTVRRDDGSPVAPESPYLPGERLSYFREVASEPQVPFAEGILLTTDHLLAADKPPFLPVHPVGGWVNECLLHRLRRRTGIEQLAPLHRLDRQTSGVVLFSTDPATRGRYQRLFATGRVHKEYLALARVPEEPDRRRWHLESRIERSEPWFRMRETPGQPNAITEAELESWKEGVGRFRLRPLTGRTHQLRLHLARLGWPILGDRLYPDLLPELPPDDFTQPLELLARRLTFTDPLTGDELEITSPQRLPARRAPEAPSTLP